MISIGLTASQKHQLEEAYNNFLKPAFEEKSIESFRKTYMLDDSFNRAFIERAIASKIPDISSVKELLTLPPEILKSYTSMPSFKFQKTLKKKIVNKKKSKVKIFEYPFQFIFEIYDKVINGSYIGQKLNIWIIDQLGIRVCPYCNNHYIDNRGETKATAQLDHFYNKSTYPAFALSLYNLVPSCFACNHAKGRKKISISPYDSLLNSNQLLSFSYRPTSSDFFWNAENLAVEIHCLEGNQSLLENIKVMQIDEAYRSHTDYLQELLKKRQIYNKDQITWLQSSFADLFNSEDEILRLAFGNYLNQSDFSKRPLSKLTYDILEELALNEILGE